MLYTNVETTNYINYAEMPRHCTMYFSEMKCKVSWSLINKHGHNYFPKRLFQYYSQKKKLLNVVLFSKDSNLGNTAKKKLTKYFELSLFIYSYFGVAFIISKITDNFK